MKVYVVSAELHYGFSHIVGVVLAKNLWKLIESFSDKDLEFMKRVDISEEEFDELKAFGSGFTVGRVRTKDGPDPCFKMNPTPLTEELLNEMVVKGEFSPLFPKSRSGDYDTYSIEEFVLEDA